MTLTRISSKEEDSNLKISIQLGLDGFSFLLKNSTARTAQSLFEDKPDSRLSMEALGDRMKAKILSLVESGQVAEFIEAIHDNEIFCLIPEIFFDETSLADYLKFNSKLLENDFLTYDKVEHLRLNIVYAPYVHINNQLLDVFGPFEYKHFATRFLEEVQEKSLTIVTNEILFVHVWHRSMYLAATRNGNLLICNRFIIETEVDLLYHLLFAMEQLHLSLDTRVYIWGDTVLLEKARVLCHTYLSNVIFENEGP